MVNILQMLTNVVITLLWRGFIELMNDNISIDYTQQRLTSANLNKQKHLLGAN